ncbi:hypothetical protein SBADM41S_07607 [Streptomyces badius]
MVTVVSAITWLPRPSTTPSPRVRIGSGPRSRSGIIPAVRVTRSPMMQCAPSSIHRSPNTVPCGKASRVPAPIAPNRSRPGCSAVTAPVRCAQAQPRVHRSGGGAARPAGEEGERVSVLRHALTVVGGAVGDPRGDL